MAISVIPQGSSATIRIKGPFGVVVNGAPADPGDVVVTSRFEAQLLISMGRADLYVAPPVISEPTDQSKKQRKDRAESGQ